MLGCSISVMCSMAESATVWHFWENLCLALMGESASVSLKAVLAYLPDLQAVEHVNGKGREAAMLGGSICVVRLVAESVSVSLFVA